MQHVNIKELTGRDISLMHELLDVFGQAFELEDVYTDSRPSVSYFERLLTGPAFIALAAVYDGAVIGGLAAYELQKFEQERSEIYLYDLAVLTAHRRQGIATLLINSLQNIAAKRGVYVIFVQADYGDEPAIALYNKLGVREDVLHFDIEPDKNSAG